MHDRATSLTLPWLLPLIAWATTAPVPGQTEPDRPPPNIVLVMADDQGYGDFGVTGNPVLDTPNLDAFATTCPKVERFYVSPVCSPTRACLMTGRYNYRTRVVDTWIGRSMMEPAEVTIAEALRGAGYRTGIFGKWHLGDCYPLRPVDQGFDVSLVHRGGGLAQPSEPIENAHRYTDPILWRNGVEEQSKGYCTDVYFENAIAFLDASLAKQQPFFVYIATNAPHGPFHDVPPRLYEKYRQRDLSAAQADKGTDPDVLARTFAMIENIDQDFGRLLAHLDERGIADDTIVVYLVDNGPVAGRYCAGLRGSKSTVYEGGIRSPLWVRWPGHFSPETTVKTIAAHIDLMPTLLAAARVAIPPSSHPDGISLLPLLEGGDEPQLDRHLVLQSHRGNEPSLEHQFAIVTDRWKLLRNSGFGAEQAPADHPFELYDLHSDPGEQHDVLQQQADVAADLRRRYRDWFENVWKTRPDNYAPPRIRPGTAAEPVTTLTRQDWRPDDRQGWGHGGAWLLHLEATCELEVTLLFQQPRRVEQVTLQLSDRSITVDSGESTARLSIGSHPFPAGDLDLRIACRTGDEKFAPYQVVLNKR